MTAIHTEIFGDGSQTIVLVHGWAMHCGIWRAFARLLAEHYRVICVDLPGHGRSKPVTPFDLATVSQALVNNLPEAPCCWLGWSMGAEIVINIAKLYPEKVNKLILLAGSPCFMKKEDWPGMDEKVMDGFAQNLQQDTANTLFRFLALQLQGDANQKAALHELKTLVEEAAPPNMITLQAGLALLKQTDLRKVFTNLNMPVAVVLGELDTLVPVSVAGKMQHLLPGLQLSIVKRAGHVLFLTHKAETIIAVQQFMEADVSS